MMHLHQVFHQTKLLDLAQLTSLNTIMGVLKLEGNCGYLCVPKQQLGQRAAALGHARILNASRL